MLENLDDMDINPPVLPVAGEGFAALDILIQGYLVIWRPESVLGKPIEVFNETHQVQLLSGDLLEIARAKTSFRTCNDQRLFRPHRHRSSSKSTETSYGPASFGEIGWFWFDECLPDVEGTTNSWKHLVGLHSELREKKGLEKIWRVLRGVCLGENDGLNFADIAGWSQDDVTKLLKKAHDDYMSLFAEEDKKCRLVALEICRSTLNHNRVKNDFINKIANTDRALPIELRGENCLAAWECIQKRLGPGPDETIAARSRAAQSGLAAWPKIEDEIRAFFECSLPEAGLSLTARGNELRTALIGERGCLDQIRRFVQEFDNIAELPKSAKQERLKLFLEAVDALHDGIAAMRYRDEDAELFGGYLTAASTGIQ